MAKLPTIKSSLIYFAIAIVVSAIVFWRVNWVLPAGSLGVARKFAQIGLVITYCGALLGSHGLFWDKKFARALADARSRVRSVEASIDMLKRIQSAFPMGNFETIGTDLHRQLVSATQDETAASVNPKLKQVEGWLALGAIIAGTCLQLLGTMGQN